MILVAKGFIFSDRSAGISVIIIREFIDDFSDGVSGVQRGDPAGGSSGAGGLLTKRGRPKCSDRTADRSGCDLPVFLLETLCLPGQPRDHRTGVQCWVVLRHEREAQRKIAGAKGIMGKCRDGRRR